MSVYYNEFSKQKAAWLRHLIEEGVIAHGIVDERSITEVQPDDLTGFTQCHFFAGIGLWSLCLRNAGWPDERPVWTGSCPCGPFSKAGLRKGFEDPRHLWPEWLRLISVCRPVVLFGEQSDEALAWLDLVSADMESNGYAIGSDIIPAAGFGGAHERHRIGFVADSDNAEWWSDRAPWHDGHWPKTGRVQSNRNAGNGRQDVVLAHPNGDGRLKTGRDAADDTPQDGGWAGNRACDGGSLIGMDDSDHRRCEGLWAYNSPDPEGASGGPYIRASGLLSGARVDWLLGRDQFWRPIESGTCPLVDAHPSRVGLLRGYGDGIDVEAFTNLIGAYMDVAPQPKPIQEAMDLTERVEEAF